jgi:ParB/RepB/Spo0J family partition protein
MVSHGQLVPVIVYRGIERFLLLDGERRWRAAQLVQISELDAVILPERPPESALRVLQMSLEAHKIGLSAMERSNFLQRIQQENGWTINDLVERLHITQPQVSKLLGCQRLCPEVQQLLHTGKLDIEKAYVISQETDHGKQQQLAQQATSISREQLRRQVRGISPSPEQTTDAATFAMPGGMCVTVKGEGLALALVIDVLNETVTQLRKGRKQGLDISTQQRVMRDTAKALRPPGKAG